MRTRWCIPPLFWMAALTQAWGASPAISFNAPKAYTVAGYPGYVLVAAADLNRDGKADLIAADGGTVSILLGTGDGSFQSPVSYTAAFDAFSIVVADFNRDGKLDLAVSEQSIGGNLPFGVAILLGNGDGTFHALPLAGVPGAGQLVVGDFNGDGIPDLATVCNFPGCPSSEAASVLLGNGDGTFQPAVNYYAAGEYPMSLVAGDFNGDGTLDLAVTVENSSSPSTGLSLSILLGNGDGTFRPGTTYTLASGGSIATADFNRDGNLDLAVSTGYPGPNAISILLGNGNGTFQPPVAYPEPGIGESIAIADFNHDGKLDLAVAGGSLSILLGNGDGTFKPPRAFPGNDADSLAVADFNSDGNLDVAVGAVYSTLASILLGNGRGGFEHYIAYPTGALAQSVAVGDFNGDSKPDLAVANSSSNNVSILLGNGNGRFQPAVDYAAGTEPKSIVAGDFNGDGQPDLALANYKSSTISILLGNSGGTFQPAVNYPVTGTPISLAVGDFNSDGKLDLAVASGSPNSVVIMFGNGDGTFQGALILPAGKGARAVVAADLNGDGKPDLAVANDGASTVTVLLGNGDGTFRNGVDYPAGSSPYSLAVADFNQDGIPDLAVANNDGYYGVSTVSVLLGAGSGTFRSPVSYLVGQQAEAVVAADFNGDGKLDLAVADYQGEAVSILPGSGDGTFQSALNFDVGAYPNSLAAADFNGGGKPDLAVAGVKVVVLTNTTRHRAGDAR